VASKSLEEWLKILWENEHVVFCVSCAVFLFVCLSPLSRLGARPPFYRSRGRRVTCAPHYLATWGSTSCYAVEWAAVWTIFAAIWP
jgi:hypothetical protein